MRIEDLSDESISVGNYEIDVTLDDGEAQVVETMKLTVLPAPLIEPPYLSPAPLSEEKFFVGEPVLITLATAIDPQGGEVSIYVASEDDFVKYDASTGGIILSSLL